MLIFCTGKPLPDLRWYQDGRALKVPFTMDSLTGKVQNELALGRLQRYHQDTTLECRAELNGTRLAATSVTINILRKSYYLF